MGGSHWLLLIPYYFFGALASLLVLILLTRLARLRPSISLLATVSVGLGIAGVTVPLLTGCLGLADYTVRRVFALVAATCVLALLDACLQPLLASPLDTELREL